MKLSISKEQLILGLQAVQNIVSTRTTLPVLSNVLLRASGERLDLTATDLDVSISTAVAATVEQPGAVTLPAKKLFAIVRELPAPQVELEVDDKNHVRIVAGSSFYKIHGVAAEEFPNISTFAESRRVTIAQDKLKNLLRRTAIAISNDESRFVLNGIFFSFKDHNVTMVATDGRRLALAEEEVDVPASSQGEFIVPSKAINELTRLLGTQHEVEIRFTQNQVGFTIQHGNGLDTVLISKLIEGNYPNYRQVIPTEMKQRITLVREEFQQALHRAEMMTSDKSNSVKLSFGKNRLEITANTPDVGESREVIAINYQGPDLAIAFNPAYAMDPLKAVDNDEVFLELIDELSPGLIKINGPFLYVLMPMRMT